MYAVIRTGGKQYRVAEGETIIVERDVIGASDNGQVRFGEVLVLGGDQPQVGVPLVDGASVEATVIREERGPKITVFRKKRRKNHTKRMQGHRQDVVHLRIDKIKA